MSIGEISSSRCIAPDPFCCESLENGGGDDFIALCVVVAGAAKRKEGQRIAVRSECFVDIDYRDVEACRRL